MLAAGVTYFEPEDSGFQHFVQDTYGQLVDAGSESAQQAAATGFQPVHFAAASTGEFSLLCLVLTTVCHAAHK